jgi:alkylhydroperoxidase/carboxymuconolactone decarboxylase family protein YurZ
MKGLILMSLNSTQYILVHARNPKVANGISQSTFIQTLSALYVPDTKYVNYAV